MSQAVRFWIRVPHLTASGIAVVLMALLTGMLFGVFHIERRLTHLTAPDMLSVKDQGLALQDEAFRDKDLLPIYGSSEFRNESYYSGRMFFSNYPTGFGLFIVGKAGSKTLIIAQRIGALGKEVRGKKVVIILSPTWFLGRQSEDSYLSNFSALQAEKLIFDSPLSLPLKADLAREMLKYRKSLSSYPLLRFELNRLAGMHDSLEDRLAMSVGRSEDRVMGLLDHVETMFALSGEMIEKAPKLLDAGKHAKTAEDWKTLVGRAANVSAPQIWESGQDAAGAKLVHKLGGRNSPFSHSMLHRTDEWQHLILLMRTLRELGAKPLFINIPINATAFEMTGVSSAELNAYYTMLKDVVSKFHYPLATFEKQQQDAFFFEDSIGHPSPMGWMIFNRTINQFYHGKLPPTLD